MKSLKLKKVIALAVAALTITALSPVGASAEWKQDSQGWWNTEGNSYSVGWRSIDNNWYYFDSNGYMKTGWVADAGKWYYMQPSGSMKTGWINDGGTWYFAAPSGEMKTGWVNDGGKWYYTAPSGAMQTGWVNDNGTWYFTSASGDMQTGVVEVNGKVYYLAESGAMQTGNVTINGVVYTFAATGEAIGDKIPTPTVRFAPNGVVITPAKPSEDTATSTGKSGGSSNNSSSTETFQQEINRLYGKYADRTIHADSDKEAGIVTLSVDFDQAVDNSKTGADYVTQDVLVTNADGTDVGVTYDSATKTYAVKGDAKVYIVVRVYRNGQIGYVTTTPRIYYNN
jgi:FOG: Glucan-binding domain (YG repeat)